MVIVFLCIIIHVLSQKPNSGCDPQAKRIDCGYSGINQEECEKKGCCWSPIKTNGLPWCFNKNAQPSPGCKTDPPCSGHGSCNTDQQCVCTKPFLTCGNASIHDCSINPNSDLKHCGDCKTVCPTVGEGVLESSCVDGACNITCDITKGYLLCFGQCVKATSCQKPPLPGCETFHENQCSGNVIITDPTFENHRWFTPLKGQPNYQESFQDYGRLVAHAHVVYDADRKSAKVQIIALHKNTAVTFRYSFDGAYQNEATKTYTSTKKTPCLLKVLASDDALINLDPIDFVWNTPSVNHSSGDYRNGQKGAIVEFFGWPHKDIANECFFLAKNGYLGAKMFPIQEQVMATQPFQKYLNPWYFMYQPVSYRLQGRMGTRDDLREAIQTCRGMGVRMYADAVINHMVGSGNDANPYHRNQNGGSCDKWPNKNSSALYTDQGMSPFYSQGFSYTYGMNTNQAPSQEFPAVPYGPTDFHCERVLNAWNDPLDLNAGWLTGLTDLNTEKENVQERIADYLTDLIGIGFSGFRIDAAKHIKPDDMVKIFSKLKRNLGGSLPADFITWWEILLGGEKQLLMCDEDSGYNYGPYLAKAFKNAGFTDEELLKIKIWNSGYPTEPNLCGVVDLRRAAIQNDDADQQNPGSSSRDMHDQGCVLIKGCDEDKHRSFEKKLFDSPYGVKDNENEFPIRLILSSYYWTDQGGMGIPDGWSDCAKCTMTCDGCISTTQAAAFDNSSTGYDKSPYTRVHRDASIIKSMRKWMKLDLD